MASGPHFAGDGVVKPARMGESEHDTGADVGRRSPVINGALYPVANGHGSDTAALAGDIHDAPSANTLLDVLESEIACFRRRQSEFPVSSLV